MLGRNCHAHRSSPWVQNATRLVRRWRNDPDHRAHVATLEFLLSHNGGCCGLDHRVSLTAVTVHLAQLGFTQFRDNVPAFQNQVLTELKREGAVATLVYPGGKGGLFIPAEETEIRKATCQVLKRVTQELSNLIDMRGSARIGDGIHSDLTNLHQVASQVRDASERSLP